MAADKSDFEKENKSALVQVRAVVVAGYGVGAWRAAGRVF